MRRDHANIRVSPVILHLPVPDKHNHRFHEYFQTSILPNQISHRESVSLRLLERITLLFAPANEDALPIPKLDQARSGAVFGFHDKHTRRPDHDVIDIESIADDVMKAAESNDAKLFELFCDEKLSLVEDVSAKRVQIRAHPTKRLHAKLYIFVPKASVNISQGL